MSKQLHTPGPWEVVPGGGIIRTAHGNPAGEAPCNKSPNTRISIMFHSMLAELTDPLASEGNEGHVVELLWQDIECSHDPGFFAGVEDAPAACVIGLRVVRQGVDITDALPAWTLGQLADVVLDATHARPTAA